MLNQFGARGFFSVAAAIAVVMLLTGAGGRFGPKSAGWQFINENSSSNNAAGEVSEFDPHWGSVGVFSSAELCAECHKASSDGSGVMRLPRSASGLDISPSAGWRHSMMAHAWNDPYFQAVVEEQANEFPAYTGDIEDKCLSCHSPMAHSHAHDTGLGLSQKDCALTDDGCYRMESASRHDHAREGVSCTLCHQMVEGDFNPSSSGNYLVPEEKDEVSRTLFGPFRDPLTRPMAINTGYKVAHSEFLGSSEHCASCHELSTPTFDVNTGHPAEPATSFREQAAYSEWRNSKFGDGEGIDNSCQDCHMPAPAKDYATAIAVPRSGIANSRWPERSPYSLHGIAGGNTYVLELLKTWREDLGISESTTEQGFERAIDAARRFLERAAQISFTCQSLERSVLELCVTIENLTGHKLPTGYPSRRMWVQLKVSNRSGDVIFESGRPNERGYLDLDDRHMHPDCLAKQKDSSFNNASCYEKHRDIITRQHQVAVYEAVIADTNDNITYGLLYGAGYLKDNRLPPRGFSSLAETYDEETAISGEASQDRDFNRAGSKQGSGKDTVRYSISLAKTDEPLVVEARLWYQSIRPAFVAAMATGGVKTQRMQAMYQQKPPLPELLAETSSILDQAR